MKKMLLIISIFFIGINITYAKETVKYADCVDGDTIKVKIKGEVKTVRMLAVDTPESVKPENKIEYYGKEAGEFTCKKIKKAKKIELEYDPNSDKVDKYDRVLAWVFIDGSLLQAEMVEKGYAKIAYLYGNYKYTDILKEKQEKAVAKGIGVWDEDAKREYDKNPIIENDDDDEYTNKEIVIIVILFLIIVFISDKAINNKAKKKLNKYL